MTAVLTDQITEETLAAFKKATTTGLSGATGLTSYDLTGLIRLIPVVTPFRDLVPRKQSPNGNSFAIWRAFMNANNTQPSPMPGIDYASNSINYIEQDFQAPYVPVGLRTSVTQDSYDLALGLGEDPFAEGSFQLMNQVLIGEDKSLIGAQNYPLAQPGTVTATPSASGGSVAASTTNMVAVAARTGYNYFYGGNSRGRASAAVTTSGSTSSITASCAAVKGALAYDWFYSSNSGTTWFYAGTTTVASFTFTATLAANNAAPSGQTLPDIFSGVPTINTAADNVSFTAGSVNGFISSLTGDYVAGANAGNLATPGTQTANPAVFIDGGGAALTLNGGSVTQIVNAFTQIYNQIKGSPTAIMMNGIVAQEIANLILAQPSAVTYLQTDEAGRVNVTAGGRVGAVVNAIANTTVPIEVHPSLPPGCIAFRTDRVPFPQSKITSTLEVRTLRDYSLFDYGVIATSNVLGGGPRREWEIRSFEAFLNRAPVSMGLLANIA